MTPEEIAAAEAAKNKKPPGLPEDYVPKNEFENVKSDMHKFKTRVKELETEKADAEKKKLTESQQWKELAEKNQLELDAERKEKEELKVNQLNTLKFNALKDNALKLGLKEEAVRDLGIVGLDGVEVEVAVNSNGTKTVNILNADKVAERLKQIRPHWFGPGKAAKVNTELPGVVQGETVSTKQVFDAEAKWQKSGSADDLQAYRKLLIQFRDQSRKT